MDCNNCKNIHFDERNGESQCFLSFEKKLSNNHHCNDFEYNPSVIDKTLELIKDQLGIYLKPCDHFAGIREHNGKKYFNALLFEPVCESKDFESLKRFSEEYKVFSVEPNGYMRISIFPTIN